MSCKGRDLAQTNTLSGNFTADVVRAREKVDTCLVVAEDVSVKKSLTVYDVFAKSITTDSLNLTNVNKGSVLVSDGTKFAEFPVAGNDLLLISDNTTPQGLRWATTTPGSGDVDGPISGATDSAIVRWDGMSGKVVQNSSATLDDAGLLTTTAINVSGATSQDILVHDGTSFASKNVGVNGQVLGVTAGNVDWVTPTSGDVVGPTASIDNALTRFDGMSGKLIQNSSATLNDTGLLTTTAINVSGAASQDILIHDGNSFASKNVGANGQVLGVTAGTIDWVTLTADVVGPAASIDNALTRFDGTTGKLIQNSLSTLDDAGLLTTTAINISGAASQDILVHNGNSFASKNVGSNGQVLGITAGNVDWVTPTANVVGPASATDNALTRFDGTTGKLIQNSSSTLDDSGVLTTEEANVNIISGPVLNYDTFLGGGAGNCDAPGEQKWQTFIVDATMPLKNIQVGAITAPTLPITVSLYAGKLNNADDPSTYMTLINTKVITSAPIVSNRITIDYSTDNITLSPGNYTWGFSSGQPGNIVWLCYSVTSTDYPALSGTIVFPFIRTFLLYINGASVVNTNAKLVMNGSLNLPLLNPSENVSTDAFGNLVSTGPVSSGDVVGPASATDNALARYDGTTGKLIQNSVSTLDDTGLLTTEEVDTNTIAAKDSTLSTTTLFQPIFGTYGSPGLQKWQTFIVTEAMSLTEIRYSTIGGPNGFPMTVNLYAGRITSNADPAGYMTLLNTKVINSVTVVPVPGPGDIASIDYSADNIILPPGDYTWGVPGGQTFYIQWGIIEDPSVTYPAVAGTSFPFIRTHGLTVYGSVINVNESLNINGFLSVNADVKQVTVGGAGAAAALPATPESYWRISIGGQNYVIPLYLEV